MVIDPWIDGGCRMTFSEFLKSLGIVIFKGEDWENPKLGNFELKPKFGLLILEDLNFSFIFYRV